MKCGTSAVNNFLRFHPRAVPTGELYFFIKSYLEGGKEPEDYKEEYLKLMPKAKEGDVIYEKTPTYHRVPKVAKRIKEMNPDMKIIFIGKGEIQGFKKNIFQFVIIHVAPSRGTSI